MTRPAPRTRQAVILVGGRGTRLGDLATHAPKPLMRIDDDSVFLDHLLFHVARQGFDDILLLSGHMGEQVRDRYDGRSLHGARLRVVIEPAPAGTAGALLNARHLLAGTFLLANGDTLFDVAVRPLEAVLGAEPEATAVLAMRRIADAGRYGRIEVEGARIRGFAEKDPGSAGQEGLINAGIGLYRREVIDRIDRLPCSIETDVYPRLVEEGRLFGVERSGYFIDIGLPETLGQARTDLPARWRRPALFLDRDGVLNHDAGYTHRIEDLHWIDGAREVLRLAAERGILTIVISNQAGIGRGMFDEAAVDRFHAAMQDDLAAVGAHIDAFYYCPYHAEATVDRWRHPDHPDRKPNPGMILRALADWPIDAATSVLIGDTDADLEAASRAGIAAVQFKGGNLLDLAGPIVEGMRRD
jgi:D-glycero-D-manno-heptose 1,7-bisphosphate phosphatase